MDIYIDKYYFIVGQFCAEGMGRSYTGYGAKFLIVHSDSLANATKIAEAYGEGCFGKREYKDMWYGEMAWNWKAEPQTLHDFQKAYSYRFNLNTYHANNAKVISTGKQMSIYEFDEHLNKFLKDYPILEITDDKIEEFKGNIYDLLPIKREPVIFPETVEGAENVNVEETNNDKEFFN